MNYDDAVIPARHAQVPSRFLFVSAWADTPARAAAEPPLLPQPPGTHRLDCGARNPETRPPPRLMPRPSARSALLAAAALIGACLCASCVPEPTRPSADGDPWIGAVGVLARTAGWPTADSTHAPPELGILGIDARPTDSLFQLAADARVLVAVTTSAGDSEVVALRHELCWTGPGSAYVCDEIIIAMDSGHTIWELRDEFRAAGTRLNSFVRSGWFGCLTVLGGDSRAALTAAGAWPYVSSANHNGVAWLDGPTAAARAALGASVAMDLSEAIRGNGVVEVQRGGAVTVTYRQPGGTLLSATAVVP